MTPTQIYLDTPEIEEMVEVTTYPCGCTVAENMMLRICHDHIDFEKSRTDSPRKLLPKLKNMSRCKAWKGKR
jgi:hypothetical protein